MLVSYSRGHTVRGNKELLAHALECSQAAVRVTSTGRAIPEELVQIGEMMGRAGKGAADIKDVIDFRAGELGIDPGLWNYDDIYRRFPTSVAKHGFDAEGLVELLQSRAEEKGMNYFAQTDKSGFMKRIFAQLDGSYNEWAQVKDSNVVIFDATHGTNRYGLKLCCFTTVGPTGMTVILALAMLKHEDADDIEWAFRCFAKTFKTAPLIIFTDGASSIEVAFDRVNGNGDIWESTKHHLCVYHLSKNLYQHLRALFITKPEVWKELHGMFWALAKTSDATFAGNAQSGDWTAVLEGGESPFVTVLSAVSEVYSSLEWNTFDSAWQKMFDLAEREAVGSTKTSGLDFLRKLYRLRYKWAACFTWRLFTGGVNSTQRAEATHSALKRKKALANFLMVSLFTHILDWNRDARDRKAVDDVRKRISHVAKGANAPPWVSELACGSHPKITPYANEHLLAQTAQALQYQFKDIDHKIGDSPVFLVQRQGHTASSFALQYDDDGQINFGEDDEDFGLSASRYSTFRLTTVNSCSCQLGTSLGIPCRYIIGLRITQQNSDRTSMNLIDLIGPKWHFISDVEESHFIRDLLRRPAPSSSHHVPSPYMSRRERYNLLIHELTSLAEVGAESEDSMNGLLAALPALSLQLSQPGGPRGSNSGVHRTAPEMPGDHSNTTSVPTDASPKVKESNDYKQFIRLLGQRFKINPERPDAEALVPESPEGASLLGRLLAMKHGEKGRGKWMIGKIVSQHALITRPSDANFMSWNFYVLYEGYTDNEPELLEHESHIGEPEVRSNASIGRWTLLSEADLGHDVEAMARNGTLHNPQDVQACKGRKQGKRFAPAFGPTSKNHKQRKER